MTMQTMFGAMRHLDVLARSHAHAPRRARPWPWKGLLYRLWDEARSRRQIEAWRHFDDNAFRDLGLNRGDLVWLTGAQAHPRDVAPR